MDLKAIAADFIMDEAENLYMLEVNTLPGMTNTSLVPKQRRCRP